MIQKIHPFLIISFLSISICLASCSGQPISTKSNSESKTEKLGKEVSEIEGGIAVIYQDQKENYWFGGKGVYHYMPSAKKIIHYSENDGLVNNRVLGIQEDKKGNVYFDTPAGVSQFNGKEFRILKVLDINASKNKWKLEPDDLWFRMGWDSGGPFRFDGDHLYQLEFPKSEQADIFFAENPNASFSPYGIYSIYKDHKGNLWFGTSSLGVCRFDGQNLDWIYEEQMTITPNGGSLGIRSTIEDKEGFYWFTNTRFKYKFSSENSGQNITYKKEDGIEYTGEDIEIDYPYFMSVTEDKQGNLWMATYDEGIWKNDGEKLTHYLVKDGKSTVTFFSIYADRHGKLWAGSLEKGIYIFDDEEFTPFKP